MNTLLILIGVTWKYNCLQTTIIISYLKLYNLVYKSDYYLE